jgi:hypothetical protein
LRGSNPREIIRAQIHFEVNSVATPR